MPKGAMLKSGCRSIGSMVKVLACGAQGLGSDSHTYFNFSHSKTVKWVSVKKAAKTCVVIIIKISSIYLQNLWLKRSENEYSIRKSNNSNKKHTKSFCVGIYTKKGTS